MRKHFPERAYAVAYVIRGSVRYQWFRTAGEREECEQNSYEKFKLWDKLDPETIYYINIRPKGTEADPRHFGIPFRHRFCQKAYDAHVDAYRRHLSHIAEQLELAKSEDENRRIAALYWARLNDQDYSAHLRTRIEYDHAKRWGYLDQWMEKHDGSGNIVAFVDEKRRKNPWKAG